MLAYILASTCTFAGGGDGGARLRARWSSGRRAVQRLLALRQAGARRLGQIYQAGPVAAQTYGAELYGLPDTVIARQRATKLRLARLLPPGVPSDLVYALLPGGQDPGLRLRFAPLERWAKEVWLSAMPTPSPADVLTSGDLRAAHAAARADEDRVPRAARHRRLMNRPRRRGLTESPAQAAIRAAQYVGGPSSRRTS